MTTTNNTSEQGKALQDTATWLAKGRECLQVIKRIEAGAIDNTAGSVPIIATADGKHLLSLCKNGSLWIMPNGRASEAVKDPEIIPAATVAMLYRFFWPIAVAEVAEVMTTVQETKQEAPPEPKPEVPRPPVFPQRLELMAAPNCDASVLTFPPRVVTIDGAQFVQLKGYDGWSEPNYPVLEVTRMEAHDGLVLVATPEHVFLLTAEHFDHPIE